MYIEKTLEIFNMKETIPSFTPMKAKTVFSKARVFSEEKDQGTTKKRRTAERLEDFTTKPLSKDPFIQLRTNIQEM